MTKTLERSYGGEQAVIPITRQKQGGGIVSVESDTRIPSDDWNPITVTDYPAEYDRLRAERPLAFTSDYEGFYGFMRYKDVQKGARDWKTYKSGQPFVEFPELPASPSLSPAFTGCPFTFSSLGIVFFWKWQ